MIKLVKPSDISSFYSTKDYYSQSLGWVRNPNYHPYGEPDGYYLLTDDIQELNNIKNLEFKGSLSPNDKISFISSDVPSLLINRMNTDIKRTTKITSSTKFVTSVNEIELHERVRIATWNEETKTMYCCDSMWISKPLSKSTEHILDYFSSYSEDISELTEDTQYIAFLISAEHCDVLQTYLDHPNNFVSDKQLIKYIWKNAPMISDDEFDTAVNLISSRDYTNQKLGFNTLQFYNLSDKIYELYKALYDNKHIYWKRQYVMFKYIHSLVCNGSYKDRKGIFNYWSRIYCNTPLKELYQNELISDKCKMEIKEEIKCRILEAINSNDSIARDLELINCEISINDKVGETESSD